MGATAIHPPYLSDLVSNAQRNDTSFFFCFACRAVRQEGLQVALSESQKRYANGTWWALCNMKVFFKLGGDKRKWGGWREKDTDVAGLINEQIWGTAV